MGLQATSVFGREGGEKDLALCFQGFQLSHRAGKYWKESVWDREGKSCVRHALKLRAVVLVTGETAAAVGLGLMYTEPLGKSVLRSIMGQFHSLQLVLKGEELTGARLAQLFKQHDDMWL